MAPQLKLAASPDDFRAATELQFRTFQAANDALHALAYPSSNPATDAEIDQIASDVPVKQAKARSEGAEPPYWLAIDDADGSLMAAARWTFYPPGSTKQYSPPSITELGGSATVNDDEDRARLAYRHWAMDKYFGFRREHARGPHAMLELCFTSAHHRRKGAGRMLVMEGVRRADELGIPCYVEASPDGERLYPQCGFRPVQTVTAVPEGGSWDGRPGWNGFKFVWLERSPTTSS